MNRSELLSIVWLTSLLLIFQPRNNPLMAYDAELIGPIIAGENSQEDSIYFEDIGTGKIWSISTDGFLDAWSPDGCHILVNTPSGWFVALILDDSTKQNIFVQSEINSGESIEPVWSPDNQSVILRRETNSGTEIYALDFRTLTRTFLFQREPPSIGVKKWLSPTELIYSDYTGYFIWNMEKQTSRFLQGHYERPSNGLPNLYADILSPNFDLVALYHNPWSTPSSEFLLGEGESPELVATLEATPREPGFTIINSNNSAEKHIDVMGEYLQSLVWSPDSEKIVVDMYVPYDSEAPGGIYVYDVKADTLTQIGRFPSSYYSTEFGPYRPSWSSDGKWLALSTSEGYAVHNLGSSETIPLNEVFSRVKVFDWSPVMDYRENPCH